MENQTILGRVLLQLLKFVVTSRLDQHVLLNIYFTLGSNTTNLAKVCTIRFKRFKLKLKFILNSICYNMICGLKRLTIELAKPHSSQEYQNNETANEMSCSIAILEDKSEKIIKLKHSH